MTNSRSDQVPRSTTQPNLLGITEVMTILDHHTVSIQKQSRSQLGKWRNQQAVMLENDASLGQ